MDWVKYWITAVSILLLYWNWVEGALSGWNESPTQYHIQTDDGNDRFFRFQTYNGQYRKERRLDDGTVVGSYGWVDPAGFLRMTDYIADTKGYRVLKSRMEYVGVKAVPEVENKKYTPMKHSTRVIRTNPVFINALESIPVTKITNESPTPALQLFDVVPTTFSPKLYETVKPLEILYQTQAPPVTIPTSTTVELYETKAPVVHKRRNIYVKSPVNQLKSNNNPESPEVNKPPRGFLVYARKSSSPNLFRNAESTRPETISVLPISRFGQNRSSFVQLNNQSENVNSSDVFKNYTTPLRRRTGFVYKIPNNHYHKDETEEDGSRTGSFGYIDPFGIRRVIHYNAGRNGFQHTKDFKYVGRQEQD